MLRLSAAIAALTAAVNGKLSDAERDNECYDYWNELEASGAGDLDYINVDTGTAVNGGSSTAVGTGTGVVFSGGKATLKHGTHDGDFGVKVPEGGGPDENGIAIGAGAGIGLEGSSSVAVASGAGIVHQGGEAETYHYSGQLDQMASAFKNIMGGNYRLRRRLMRDMCDPPPATGGAPVTCASTGDPHIRDFRGRKFDNMAFGEFVWYQSWAPKSHNPRAFANLSIHVRQGSFNGSPTVAANHGIVVGGRFACGNRYEIHKAGGQTAVLRIFRKGTGNVETASGAAAIRAKLAQEGDKCMPVVVQGGVIHMIFEQNAQKERTVLRVQIMSYGLNLGLDVLGQTARLETDTGLCTKNANWDQQLLCQHTMFTWYPSGQSCESLHRTRHTGGPPEQCRKTLVNAATQRCGKCPETIDPQSCVYDACAADHVSPGTGFQMIEEIMEGCNVGVPLPKNINVRVGVGYNMKGATSVAVGNGVGLLYGTSTTTVINGN